MSYSEKNAPPAYTAAPNKMAVLAGPVGDDRYAFLSSFDTVFLIDDSGSMTGRSWRETEEALETIVPICVQYDDDGIDIHFLVRIYKHRSHDDGKKDSWR